LIHFISGEPLALNREVMQSPYFSFYSERKPYDFNTSVRHYEIAYADVSEFFISQALSFDQASKAQFIEWLKKDDKLQVSYLTLLGAVHYPEDKGREIAVVYHLHSLVNNFRIRLKAFIPIENPTISTITDLYANSKLP
jgi:NADH-quinone oxidoreductase subunit C